MIKKSPSFQNSLILDPGEYRDQFPKARALRRTHTLFVGPTNSGKTHRALELLKKAEQGAYLSPLRLLALEVQETLLAENKTTSLITGEETDIRPDASIISSTIEMMDLEKTIDLAVIDEVQMIFDTARGWAWTQALVGMPARHICMTGAPECIPLIKKLVRTYLGEELKIVELKRHGALVVDTRPMTFEKVPAQSAIIAFSRREVLSLKAEYERRGRKVAVLYGALGPSVRRAEAERFIAEEAGILIATDCIGMGLNLPIKQVFFYATDKFDGTRTRPLHAGEVRQIGGRAGRYQQFEQGTIGAFRKKDLLFIARALEKKIAPDKDAKAFIAPTETEIARILKLLHNPRAISMALHLFGMRQVNTFFTSARLLDQITLARSLEPIKSLSGDDIYSFSFATIDIKNTKVLDYFLSLARRYGSQTPITFAEEKETIERTSGSLGRKKTITMDDLAIVETRLKMAHAYYWMSRKSPAFFPDRQEVAAYKDELDTIIASLLRSRLTKRCRSCGREMTNNLHTMQLCTSCQDG